MGLDVALVTFNFVPFLFLFTIIDYLAVQSGQYEAGDICLRVLSTSKANETAAKHEAGLSGIVAIGGSGGNPLRDTTSHSPRGLPIGRVTFPDAHCWGDMTASQCLRRACEAAWPTHTRERLPHSL